MATVKKTQHSTTAAAQKPIRPRHASILHLCAELEAEDPAREVVDLAILSQRNGWPAIIASSGGALVQESERTGVPHRLVPLNRKRGMFNDWRIRLKLESLLQKDRPRLIHAHGLETLSYALSVVRRNRIPLVADILHPVTDTPVNRRLLEEAMSLSAYLRVPTEFMGYHLHREFSIPVERIFHVPSGVDLQWFSTAHVTPERLGNITRAWRLPEQGAIILVPLPLAPDMGHRQILEALAKTRNPNVYMVLMGRGASPSLHKEITDLVEDLGLAGKVVMPEFSTDLPAAFWHASVVVLPNVSPRGECRALLAAQAMGRPTIITDVGANRELVDAETAWVAPAGNVDALAKALEGAIKLDVNHRLGLAERERDFIAEKFAHTSWLENTFDMYATVLETGARKPARTKAA